MLYVISHQEKQIKTTMRFNYIPIRMTKLWTLTASDAGKNVGQWELLFIVDKNAK